MIGAIADAARHAREHRSFLLMAALIATLAIGPWLEEVGARAVVYGLAIAAFASAIHAVGGRGHAAAVVVLGTVTFALVIAARATGSHAWGSLALISFVASGLLLIVRVFRYVVTPGAITLDKIYAAISVYLVAGFTWGGIFALVEWLRPGSFQWSQLLAHDPKTLLQSFVYLSFVTLASLGYGDITPVTPEARSLALLEVMFGTFYVVVVIARVVSSFDADSHRTGQRP